jgi:hypothetical protein
MPSAVVVRAAIAACQALPPLARGASVEERERKNGSDI